ncbi:hemolysin family protein [Dermatophilaceae bacterium Sec6.4]
MTLLLVFALLSVIFGFLLAATESAVARMGVHHVEDLVDDGRRGAPALLELVKDSGAVAMTLALLRVLAEATAAVLVTIAVGDAVSSLWARLLVSIAVMALASFVLVGVSPRTLGRQHGEAISLFVAPIVLSLRTLMGPIARLLVALGNAVTPGHGYLNGPFDSEAELREYVDLATDSELIEADERKMIHSVFELGDTLAHELMVPRTDMVTIDRAKTLRQAMSLFQRTGFSRIPVVDDGPDDIIGILYFKDVAGRLVDGRVDSRAACDAVMRSAVYVPDSKPADDLLREMQVARRHFAVVIDEYGGTAGLVTLEDIVEEVVGEIDDEYDRATPGTEELGGGKVRVPARMSVDDVAEHFDVTIEEDDVDTVGGLLGKLVGRVPIPGASAQLGDLRLTAERMAGRRHQLATVVIERVLEQSDDDLNATQSAKSVAQPLEERAS